MYLLRLDIPHQLHQADDDIPNQPANQYVQGSTVEFVPELRLDDSSDIIAILHVKA